MQTHPESPVRPAELKLDATKRHYITREGVNYRVKTSLREYAPRKFAKFIEITTPV